MDRRGLCARRGLPIRMMSAAGPPPSGGPGRPHNDDPGKEAWPSACPTRPNREHLACPDAVRRALRPPRGPSPSSPSAPPPATPWRPRPATRSWCASTRARRAAERAGVARALDADATAGLAGGWRVYELPGSDDAGAGARAARRRSGGGRRPPRPAPAPARRAERPAVRVAVGAAEDRRPFGLGRGHDGDPGDRRGHRHGHRHDAPRPGRAAVDERRRGPGQQRRRRRRRPEGRRPRVELRGRERAALQRRRQRDARHARRRDGRGAARQRAWAWPGWPTTRASWRSSS